MNDEKRPAESRGLDLPVWDLVPDALSSGETPVLEEEEKDRIILSILDKGLTGRKAARPGILAALKQLGMGGIFFGTEEYLFLGILTGLIGWQFVTRRAAAVTESSILESSSLYPLVFFFSPLMYWLLTALSVWKDISAKLYERKAVCYYNLPLLTAVRSLFFGALSLIITGGADLVIWNILAAGERDADLTVLLQISFSALFLFGALHYLSLWRCKSPLCHLLPLLIWGILGALLILSGDAGCLLLQEVPPLCYFGIMFTSACVSALAMRRFLYGGKEESISNAAYL